MCIAVVDATFMKPGHVRSRRWHIMCPNESAYARVLVTPEGKELLYGQLCKSCYDDKVYRGEDVAQFKSLTPGNPFAIVRMS